MVVLVKFVSNTNKYITLGIFKNVTYYHFADYNSLNVPPVSHDKVIYIDLSFWYKEDIQTESGRRVSNYSCNPYYTIS